MNYFKKDNIMRILPAKNKLSEIPLKYILLSNSMTYMLLITQ